jgi:hypothetical protein
VHHGERQEVSVGWSGFDSDSVLGNPEEHRVVAGRVDHRLPLVLDE